MHRLISDHFDQSDLMLWIMVNGMRVIWLVAATFALRWFLERARCWVRST